MKVSYSITINEYLQWVDSDYLQKYNVFLGLYRCVNTLAIPVHTKLLFLSLAINNILRTFIIL